MPCRLTYCSSPSTSPSLTLTTHPHYPHTLTHYVTPLPPPSPSILPSLIPPAPKARGQGSPTLRACLHRRSGTDRRISRFHMHAPASYDFSPPRPQRRAENTMGRATRRVTVRRATASLFRRRWRGCWEAVGVGRVEGSGGDGGDGWCVSFEHCRSTACMCGFELLSNSSLKNESQLTHLSAFPPRCVRARQAVQKCVELNLACESGPGPSVSTAPSSSAWASQTSSHSCSSCPSLAQIRKESRHSGTDRPNQVEHAWTNPHAPRRRCVCRNM